MYFATDFKYSCSGLVTNLKYGVSTSSEVFSNHQMASREKVGVLINMADQRMYHAKGMGKNRVVFEI